MISRFVVSIFPVGVLAFGVASGQTYPHKPVHIVTINIVRIIYKGGGPATLGLIGGEVQLTIQSASSLVPHVKSGRIRALAVTSAQPTALVPGLPTVATSGVPGYEVTSTVALFAPGKTPAAIISRLNRETVRYLKRKDVEERYFQYRSRDPGYFAGGIRSRDKV